MKHTQGPNNSTKAHGRLIARQSPAVVFVAFLAVFAFLRSLSGFISRHEPIVAFLFCY